MFFCISKYRLTIFSCQVLLPLLGAGEKSMHRLYGLLVIGRVFSGEKNLLKTFLLDCVSWVLLKWRNSKAVDWQPAAGEVHFTFRKGEKMRRMMNQSTKPGWQQSGAMLLVVLAVVCMVIITAMPAPVQAACKVTEISLNQTKFKPTAPEIKGVAKVTGAEKGQKITADLIYGPENLKALTITKDIPNAGDVTFNFAFSKPTKGWPIGDYKVVISTSDGASNAAAFQVEK